MSLKEAGTACKSPLAPRGDAALTQSSVRAA